MKKRVLFIGTVGLPAKYGGFETLVDNITRQISDKVECSVICSSKSYDDRVSEYNNSKMIYVPLEANGFQSIFYDIVSIFIGRKYDSIVILGVSGCIILPVFKLFFRKTKVIVNVDGIEWKRKKWKSYAKFFLKISEFIAVKSSDIVISDNDGIKEHLFREYKRESVMIPYGGDHVQEDNCSAPANVQFDFSGSNYFLKICRIEPENNIELILESFLLSKSDYYLVIIGNWQYSLYGSQLKNKYANYDNIKLLDPIYEPNKINYIRSNCSVYVHGHSAGGTNPSLVEAMYLGLPIFAYDVIYNRKTTREEAFYFKNSDQLKKLIDEIETINLESLGEKMKSIAQERYTWEIIARQYLDLI